MVADRRVRADIGKGTDSRVRADGALIELRGVHLGLVADRAVADHGVRADGAVFPDDRPAAQDRAGEDDRAAADRHAGVDVGVVGVHDGNARGKVLVRDLAAAHILRRAQLFLVADGEKALGDLGPLGEGRERAVLFEYLAALLGVRRVDRAAGEDAHGQHRAVDDEHAAFFALEKLQKLFAVLCPVHIGDVGLFGDIGAHHIVRAHIGYNKKPLDALSHQFVDHPREDGAEQDGP